MLHTKFFSTLAIPVIFSYIKAIRELSKIEVMTNEVKARKARSESLTFLRQEKVKPLKSASHFADGWNVAVSLFLSCTFFEIWR